MSDRVEQTQETIRKAICRDLLALAYEHGKLRGLSLTPKQLYDPDTQSGILWPYGEHGNGLLDVTDDGEYAYVYVESRDLLENWSRE